MNKVQLSPSMMEAAQYIPVYTRPTEEEVKAPPLKKGCFECSHSTANMGESQYRTFFVYRVDASLLKLDRMFGLVLSFGDKFWEENRPHFFTNYMGSPPYKFPRLVSYYQNGSDFPPQHEIYLRQYKIKNEPTIHTNTTMTNEELFRGIVKGSNNLLVVGQPASWGLGNYLSLDTDDRKIRSEEIEVEDMRFQSEYKRERFIKQFVQADRNPIFRVYPDGSTKKVPKPR